MKKLLVLTLLFILYAKPSKSQSKYLDSTKTTFSFSGVLGSSEAATSTSIGGTFILKGALDIGIQIGKTRTKKNLIDDNYDSLVKKGTIGSFVSAQAYLYMLSQNKGSIINFGVTLGGSSTSYDEADLTSFLAGFHLSRKETDDGLTAILPSLELGFVLLNEFTDKKYGGTITSKPFLTGSISFGISRKLKDSKVIFFEPGIIYENLGQSLSGGLALGLIF